MSFYDHIDTDSEGNWRQLVPNGGATMYFSTVDSQGKPSECIVAGSLSEARKIAKSKGLKVVPD